jgi:glycosyltransferase involved in cell wall biosynthesis
MREAAVDGDRDRRLVGVLVTFRRPAELSTSLARLADQDRPLDHLVVVDNDRSARAADLVDEFVRQGNDASYVATPENLGPAGGIAIGMEHALRRARDADWIVLVDDDDPPDEPSVLSNMANFGAEMLAADPRTAGVGLVGARFDWRRGRLNRIGDAELIGAVPVDYIGGNQFPFYLASAVRDVGPFATNLFFGFDDLEYGLRLRRSGYRLFASGSLWLEQRRRQGRLGLHVRPAGALGEPGWRRYYSLRNTIHILRSNGRGATAARVAVVRGIAKPLANVPRGPRAAWRHLRLGARACRDGWMGKMGRTIEPDGYDGVDPRAVSG